MKRRTTNAKYYPPRKEVIKVSDDKETDSGMFPLMRIGCTSDIMARRAVLRTTKFQTLYVPLDKRIEGKIMEEKSTSVYRASSINGMSRERYSLFFISGV